MHRVLFFKHSFRERIWYKRKIINFGFDLGKITVRYVELYKIRVSRSVGWLFASVVFSQLSRGLHRILPPFLFFHPYKTGCPIWFFASTLIAVSCLSHCTVSYTLGSSLFALAFSHWGHKSGDKNWSKNMLMWSIPFFPENFLAQTFYLVNKFVWPNLMWNKSLYNPQFEFRGVF